MSCNRDQGRKSWCIGSCRNNVATFDWVKPKLLTHVNFIGTILNGSESEVHTFGDYWALQGLAKLRFALAIP
jgi:hypothetical protein